MHAMNITEVFLIAMTIIFSVPYLIWRLGKSDYWAPLVVVQIIAGILLGPGILGAIFPEYYEFVFNPDVVQTLTGIAWWGVMIFVFLAGVELDLAKPGNTNTKAALPLVSRWERHCCLAVLPARAC